MKSEGHGVIDGDGLSLVVFVFMAFFLVYFVANGGALSPINGASTINGQNPQTNLGTAYTNLKWFLYMLIPITPYLIIKGWSEVNKRESAKLDE